MGFLLGLLTGIVLTPILLAVIAKPLSKWFFKRKINSFFKDVSDNAKRKMDKFEGAVSYN